MYFLLKMVIFHCYVSLPEGISIGYVFKLGYPTPTQLRENVALYTLVAQELVELRFETLEEPSKGQDEKVEHFELQLLGHFELLGFVSLRIHTPPRVGLMVPIPSPQ